MVNRTSEREPHPPKGGTEIGGGELKGTFFLRGLEGEAMEQLERFVQLQQDEDSCLQERLSAGKIDSQCSCEIRHVKF